MSDCPENSLLHRLLDGTLDDKTLSVLEGHIENCERCQANLDSITAMSSPDAGRIVPGIPDSGELPGRVAHHIASNLADKLGEAKNRLKTKDTSSCMVAPNQNPHFSNFRLVREIGRGGMGVVFEAVQLQLNRTVALKVLPRHLFINEVSVARFQREARSASQLHHTNIVPVFEFGEDNGSYYYSMQLIDGVSLDQVVPSTSANSQSACSTSRNGGDTVEDTSGANILAGDDSHLPRQLSLDSHVQEALARLVQEGSREKGIARIGEQIASALHHAHERGIVHRDVKPSNILLDSEGTAWLADFGLAKQREDQVTGSLEAPGTLRFMAPERFEGRCDARSDVYSLGITLYELLASQPAFASRDHASLIGKVLHEPPPKLSSIDSSISVDLRRIVEKAIGKQPGQRYGNAQALAQDLANFLEDRPVSARQISAFEHGISWAKRNPAISSLLACTVLLVCTLLSGATYAAFRFRNMAREQTRLANLAEVESSQNQQNLYYAEMISAAEAAGSPNGLARVLELTDHWIPGDSEEDRRGFEWYWLSSVAHPTTKKMLSGEAHFIHFTPDSTLFCWGNTTSLTVSTWPECEEVHVIEARGRAFEDAKVSPDGSYVGIRFFKSLDAGAQAGCEILDIHRGEKVAACDGSFLRGFAWSADSRLLAVVHFEEGDWKRPWLKVFDTETWGSVHDERITIGVGVSFPVLAFSPDGNRLAVSNDEQGSQGVGLWDTETWTRSERLTWSNIDLLKAVAWHPNSRELAIISTDGGYAIGNLEDQSIRESKTEAWMNSVQWHPTGQTFLLAGNGAVRWVDRESMQVAQYWQCAEDFSGCAAISDQGDVVVATSERGTNENRAALSLYERTHKAIINFENEDAGSISWSPDGRLVAVSSDGTAVWHADDGRRLSFSNGSDKLDGGSIGWLSPREIVLRSADTVRAVNVITSGELWRREDVLKMPRKGPAKRMFYPLTHLDPEKLHSYVFTLEPASESSILERVDLQTGKREDLVAAKTGNRRLQSSAMGPHHGLIAVSAERELLLFSLVQERVTARTEREALIESISWNHAGSRIAIALRDGQIQLLDSASLETTAVYKGHRGRVSSLSWSPDGTRLASGGLGDHSLRVWDTANGKCAMVVKLQDAVSSVAWSPGGRRLAAAAVNGKGKILDATTAYEDWAVRPESP